MGEVVCTPFSRFNSFICCQHAVKGELMYVFKCTTNTHVQCSSFPRGSPTKQLQSHCPAYVNEFSALTHRVSDWIAFSCTAEKPVVSVLRHCICSRKAASTSVGKAGHFRACEIFKGVLDQKRSMWGFQGGLRCLHTKFGVPGTFLEGSRQVWVKVYHWVTFRMGTLL